MRVVLDVVCVVSATDVDSVVLWNSTVVGSSDVEDRAVEREELRGLEVALDDMRSVDSVLGAVDEA